MSGLSIGALNPVSPATDLPNLAAPQPSAPSKMPLDAKAMDAAKKFESVLVNRLAQEMKRTIPQSGLLNTSATDQYQDMFWSQLADEIGKKGGLGLAKQIYKQIAKTDASAGADGTSATEMLGTLK